jgi:hypothetical protein
VLESYLSIVARPLEVTSYSQPPANEHTRLEVLDVIETSFAKFTYDSANTCIELPDFKNERIGAMTSVVKGTPRMKVAVAYVASSTTTESASIPLNSANGEYSSENSKSVPVKTMVFSSVIAAEVTFGKVAASSCSYSQTVVSVLMHA